MKKKGEMLFNHVNILIKGGVIGGIVSILYIIITNYNIFGFPGKVLYYLSIPSEFLSKFFYYPFCSSAEEGFYNCPTYASIIFFAILILIGILLGIIIAGIIKKIKNR